MAAIVLFEVLLNRLSLHAELLGDSNFIGNSELKPRGYIL